MNKVKTGLRGLNAAQKVIRAGAIAEAMRKSGAYKMNAPVLDELENGCEMLEKAIEMAEFGDKRALALRKLCEQKLVNQIRQVATLVNHVSKGDDSIIIASGFEVQKRNNQPLKMARPENLKCTRTESEGTIVLSWKSVVNSKNYMVQLSEKPPKKDGDWMAKGFSTRSRLQIDGLKPGKKYWLRTIAIGAKGLGPPSEVMQIIAV